MTDRTRSRLKLHHLRLLSALETAGSLAGAGSLLGLTQPALTKALREIEAIAGNRLFERHARGMSPNNAGARASEAARVILGDLALLERQLDEWGAEVEDLTIGALPSAAVGLLPRALPKLLEWRPNLRVHVREGSTAVLASALRNGELDLVLGRIDTQSDPEQFDRIQLYDDVIVGIMRADHPLNSCDTITPALLADQIVTLPLMVNAAEREITKLLVAAGFAVKPSLYAMSLALLIEFVLSTNAVAFLPRLMVAGELDRGVLRTFIELPQTGGRRGGALMRQGATQPPVVRDVIRSIVETSPFDDSITAEARRWLGAC